MSSSNILTSGQIATLIDAYKKPWKKKNLSEPSEGEVELGRRVPRYIRSTSASRKHLYDDPTRTRLLKECCAALSTDTIKTHRESGYDTDVDIDAYSTNPYENNYAKLKTLALRCCDDLEQNEQNEQNKQNDGGSSKKYIYKNKAYKVHTGERGGKYILVNKRKVYI